MRRAVLATTLALVAAGCAGDDRRAGPVAGAAPTRVATTTTPQPAALGAASKRADPPSTLVESTTTTTTSATTAATSTTTGVTATMTVTTTTTTLPPWPRSITMAFTGDTLPHSPLWRRAARNAADAGRDGHDFGPMLAELAPLLEPVDVAVCHLETPIAPEGEEFTTFPFYGVPAEIADAIADAGYDRCSTASNHTADRGPEGIDRTVEVLGSRGIGQSGMARTPAEIEPQVVDVGGVGVSHLSYTWSYNGLSLPDGEEWRSALIDVDRILADAASARERGAHVVVVSLHWGAERVHGVTSWQRRIAEELTAGGTLDLIVGHHAHVVQPIEQVNGTWVVFGLGNILSNLPTNSSWPAATQDAVVVTVELAVGAGGAVTVGRPVVHPTWVDKDAGWVVRQVDAELARDDLTAGQRGRLERSRARTEAILGDFFPAVESAEPAEPAQPSESTPVAG